MQSGPNDLIGGGRTAAVRVPPPPRGGGSSVRKGSSHQAGSLDTLVASSIRFILALSGLLIVLLIPEEPDRHVALTYAALTLYTLYCTIILLLDLAGRRAPAFVSESAAKRP